MAKQKIKVGVIGAGSMGQHHIRVYSNMKNVELIGIADVQKDRVRSIAHQHGTNYFTDQKDLLKEKPDAVSIAVPTALHKDAALAAISKGVNVLLEKPIADTVLSAEEIIEKADDKGIKLLIGHIERFNPAVLKLKEEIDLENLGKIVAMSTVRVGPYNPRIRDVGIITDLAVHDIDIMSYLYGEKVHSVNAYAGSVVHKLEDYTSMIIGFGNGHAGVIETNWLTPNKIRTLTVTGTKGIAYADYLDQTLRICNERGETQVKVEKKEPLVSEIEHFIDCVNNDTEPLVSGRDGKSALEVAIAAIKAYKENQTVML
jgi:UDP-N-acetylglucosamine 3-dehydrogenase